MKTDLEKFIELYKSIGIELATKDYDKKGSVFCTIEAGDNDKLKGYPGFYTNIVFDVNGKFIEQGFYE